MIGYGFYNRKIKLGSDCGCKVITLRIQRVQCKACHRTHALLPDSLVPYSQIPLSDQQEIIQLAEEGKPVEPVLERNNLIEESSARYIVSQYRKHWKQRLLSIGKTLADELAAPCLQAYHRQFMQIHRTANLLFIPPT